MIHPIEKGQIWKSLNGTEFHIDDIRSTSEEVWIHYTNTFTQQTYSSLDTAFRLRFTPILNQS